MYLCQIWNEVYSYWDVDELVNSARAALAFQNKWREWGWKVKISNLGGMK